ncbi:MAG: 3'-5' exonuclease [Erysipelotrichaceae bacterium]|nr:3'-5' exonuclease [Erysipelotrichaceae bacterium]
MKITAIDFETANRSMASVCSVGISTMQDGILGDSYYTLIKPEGNVNRFDPWNIRIHGIHPQDVKDAPEFTEIYKSLTDQFDNALVCAHNAKFDMTCLKQTCLNTGKPIPYITYFDTLELSRRAFPQMAHHRLNDMCDYLNIELDHHNALSDSYGCLMIVKRLMEITGISSLDELLKKYHVRRHEL